MGGSHDPIHWNHPSQSQTWGFVCQEPEAEAEDAKLDGELTKLTKKAMPK